MGSHHPVVAERLEDTTPRARREPTFARLLKRGTQAGELGLEVDRHRFLLNGLAHELAQLLLEAIALAAVRALVEMHLRLRALRIGDHAVHVRLHHLLAVRAGIVRRHVSSPPTTDSAIACLRIRRPRCRRDITVPMGMSRIWAASA